jgi:DNA polymerase-3 subunit alpha
MEPAFIHLHLHSEYSLCDGVMRLKPLVQAAAAMKMPAVAVTDEHNLFGLVRFYKAALAAGIKPIAGSELLIRDPDEPTRPFRVVLLVQNQQGYRHLSQLISRAYLQRTQQMNQPLIEHDWLDPENTAGLIALSGGMHGDVGRALLHQQPALAEQRLTRWLHCFGDRYYIEVMRTGRDQEETYLQAAVELAIQHQLPLVATNDVRFLAADDFEAHEIRVCIHDGSTLADPHRPRRYHPEQYLRSPEEMARLFSDLPEALRNSVEIAKRCNLEFEFGRSFLPAFPVPAGSTVEAHLTQVAQAGLAWHLQRDQHAISETTPRSVYEQRLQTELAVIIQMGFSGYFLIVADFIQWARTQGIPVGPGRGSGAGSLVAYALKITDLDPIQHDLLFERFLNPERVSMPDFDIDFCMEGRDRVIDYVADKYGRAAVSQIITFGTMAAKAVVRDVGRVLGHPYGFVDKIAKMIPFELGMTLAKALADSDDLKAAYAEDETVTTLLDMASKLEGLVRNAGKHAGGVVIAPTQLTDFTPLYCEPGGANLVTQFDKDDVEQVGLVKFDFLGLRTLTIINWAVQSINAYRAQQNETPVDISLIDAQDQQAFALLQRCATTAVFQLESPGMKELIKKLRPDSFEDMTALVALFRPGPLQSGMVDDFIARKHGQAAIAYPHPDLEGILKPTYGVILYQEQVMQIAQVLAGYSLGGADLLRRAMGKKKPAEMIKQRQIFEQGAIQRGVEHHIATHIFDLMEKFAGYGFNKSHSAAYALIAYQTLWLKAHYPAAFMAAALSADSDNTDKVVILIDECRTLDLPIISPCVNQSQSHFITPDQHHILYGLGAIKGVGDAAIEAILSAREEAGPFHDLWDFCRRMDLRKVNKRVIEALIRAGACDRLGVNRATLMVQLPAALKFAEQAQTHHHTGQNDLFSMAVAETSIHLDIDQQIVQQTWPEWDDEERLYGEKETLGFYLTGHPITIYEAEIQELAPRRIADLIHRPKENAPETNWQNKEGQNDNYTIIGLVIHIRFNKTHRGRMASLTMDDQTGRIEVTIFSELYEAVRHQLGTDKIFVITGRLAVDHFRDSWTLRATQVKTLEDIRAETARALAITLDFSTPERYEQADLTVNALEKSLQSFREQQGLVVYLRYRGLGCYGELRCGSTWHVRPTDELLKQLRMLFGRQAIQIMYSQPVAAAPAAVNKVAQLHG